MDYDLPDDENWEGEFIGGDDDGVAWVGDDKKFEECINDAIGDEEKNKCLELPLPKGGRRKRRRRKSRKKSRKSRKKRRKSRKKRKTRRRRKRR